MIKTFTVDTSNIEEMLKLRNTLSSMIGNAKREQTGAVSKRENIRKKYHAMRNILETDISHLWENDFLSTERKFYVYFHCDPTRTLKIQSNPDHAFAASLNAPNVPFYVGKGTGSRAFDLDRNGSHRKIRQKIKMFNKDVIPIIVQENLTEAEALALEAKLIDIFGLTSVGGCLVNLDECVHKERRDIYKNDLKKISNYYENILT